MGRLKLSSFQLKRRHLRDATALFLFHFSVDFNSPTSSFEEKNHSFVLFFFLHDKIKASLKHVSRLVLVYMPNCPKQHIHIS